MKRPSFEALRGWAAPAAAGAIAALLFASSAWLPLAGVALSLTSPLPLALAAAKRGAAAAGVAFAAGTAGSFVLTGPLGSAVFAAQFAASGCALGLAVRLRRSPEVAIGGYALLAFAAFWAMMAAAALSEGTAVGALIEQNIREAVDAASQIIARDSGAEAAAVATWSADVLRFLCRAFPGLIALFGILAGWLNAVALRRIMGEVSGPSWSRWRAPELWIWVLIAAGLAGLLGGNGTLGTAGLNVFLAALGVYFLQGVAVIQNFFESKGVPRFFRAAIYILLFLQFPVMILVTALGAFDLWLDFRSRWSPRPPEPGAPNQSEDSPERRRIG